MASSTMFFFDVLHSKDKKALSCLSGENISWVYSKRRRKIMRQNAKNAVWNYMIQYV